jgi:uncharacterized membrane protein
MNKYQKQAIIDMGKVVIGIVAVIALVNTIIFLGMSSGDLVGAVSIVVMGYCIYQLYRIRVGQLESQDRLSEMEQKYK